MLTRFFSVLWYFDMKKWWRVYRTQTVIIKNACLAII